MGEVFIFDSSFSLCKCFCNFKNNSYCRDGFSDEHELADAGWVSPLKRRLVENQFFYQVVNESRSGETTASAVTRIPKLLKTYSPEIVIIQLGVNDAMRKVSLPLVRNNLRNIIRDSLFAHSKVLVLRTCLPTDSKEDYRRQFAKIYEQVTNETNTELTPCFVKGLNWKTTEDFNEIYTSKSVQFILLDNVWVDLFPLLSK